MWCSKISSLTDMLSGVQKTKTKKQEKKKQFDPAPFPFTST
jgi:hypothetical protein